MQYFSCTYFGMPFLRRHSAREGRTEIVTSFPLSRSIVVAFIVIHRGLICDTIVRRSFIVVLERKAYGVTMTSAGGLYGPYCRCLRTSKREWHFRPDSFMSTAWIGRHLGGKLGENPGAQYIFVLSSSFPPPPLPAGPPSLLLNQHSAHVQHTHLAIK